MNFSGTNFPLHNKRLTARWLIIGLIILLLTLTACGSGTSPVNENEATTVVAPTAEPMVPTATPAGGPPAALATAEALMPRGKLRVAMQPVINLDPLTIASDSEVLFANHVYDYLVDIDHLSNPIPRLANDWVVSDDGLDYLFNLAEGVTWHDGTPFTADDVVWTFERLRDAEGTPTANLYRNVVEITATNKSQVRFILRHPNPFFLYDLSDNHALILPAGTTDPAASFNGTGPFIVTDYDADTGIQMKANSAYFIPGQPRLASLDIIFFEEEPAMADALRQGEVDLMLRMSTPLYNSLQSAPGINTFNIPTNGFDLIRLRADRPPGDDPRVIQALKLATHRQALLNVVHQGYGAVGNDSPIGPLYNTYHDPSVVAPQRDIEAARTLLAEAGYGEGLDLTLHVPDSGGRPDLAAVLKQQWADAGVNITINVEPENVYYGDNMWLEVDLGITGWGSRPYPQFYLDQMLVTDAEWNESHFSDAEFDALAETAGTTLDEAERIEAYSAIQELLIERGPVIIPYYFAQFGALRDKFTGLQLKAFAGRTDFRNVTYTGEN